jgi:cyclophilin family peptidyl-prolyl cis-trans isomerase
MSILLIALIIIIVIIILYFGYRYFFGSKSNGSFFSFFSSTQKQESQKIPDSEDNPSLDKNQNQTQNQEEMEHFLEKDESKQKKMDLDNGNPYFILAIGNNVLGKVKFELFDEEAPKTCKNFRYFCTRSMLNNNYPDYQGSIFHRVIKDFMIQGGDITNFDGTGGISMYGVKFDDENLNLEHNQPGLLCMANSGPNTNNSQFYITLKETPWLNGKHVVFGIVLEGFDIIKKIEGLETSQETNKPLDDVKIIKCGLE